MAEDSPGMIWTGACPLCGAEDDHPLFHRDRLRSYFLCGRCDLVFVPGPWQVSREREKARYDHHRNSREDRGYRDFLGRIIPFLEKALPPGAREGLDFGCGPEPVLAEMLEERGYRVARYDLYYRNEPELLSGRKYDFITGTEVFEHLAAPGEDADRLLSLLYSEGVLALMTRFREEETDFSRWFYKDDETHISFFSRRTFLLLGSEKGLDVSFRDKDMVILKRKGSDNEQYET